MSKERNVRVRFAPSPTGPLHIGGARTALYNYFFALQHGGSMLLRIEDTDEARFVEGAEDYIMRSLDWLGIEIDEGVGVGGPNGPYRQSERREIYRTYVRQLLDSGKAYKAFDTLQELEEARSKIENFQYDATTRLQMRNSLTMNPKEVQECLDSGTPYVVRFLVEPGEDIILHDLIRGEVSINTLVLDDKVLYKSAEDLPTYHLANVVDDHLMDISHVIRGEEWLPSTPLHILLYRAFGWETPEFAHLPLVLKPDGNGKLSKRDGERLGFPVYPLMWKDADGTKSLGYKEYGFLSKAVVNFLALLGWHPSDEREIFSMKELIHNFSLERVNKSGAKFDFEKAKWFNHKYIQETSARKLAKKAVPFMEKAGLHIERYDLERAIELVRERLYLLSDIPEQTHFLFHAPTEYDEKTIKKCWLADTPRQLEEFIDMLDEYPNKEELERSTPEWIEQKGYNMGGVMNAIRLALVGKPMGPHIYDIIDFIGFDESKRRIQKAIDTLR